MGRGLGSNPFKFSIAIFGPKCGRTHYVALKIPVSLWSSASKIEKYSAFSMYSESLPRNVHTKQDDRNKIYKFYKGTFTDFACYLFVCLFVDVHITKQHQLGPIPGIFRYENHYKQPNFLWKYNSSVSGSSWFFVTFENITQICIHSWNIYKDTFNYCLWNSNTETKEYGLINKWKRKSQTLYFFLLW